MSISFFGLGSNPTDGGTAVYADPGMPMEVVPPSSMQNNDLVLALQMIRDVSITLSVDTTGGQTWNSLSQLNGGSVTARLHWAQFNGTWSVNPKFTSSFRGSYAKCTTIMAVYRSTGTPTWAVDTALVNSSLQADPGSSPHDLVADAHTTTDSSTLSFYAFLYNIFGGDTCALQTGGWSNPGGTTQFRNVASESTDLTIALAHKINTSSGSQGTVTNRTTGNYGFAYWMNVAFKNQEVATVGKRGLLMGVG